MASGTTNNDSEAVTGRKAEQLSPDIFLKLQWQANERLYLDHREIPMSQPLLSDFVGTRPCVLRYVVVKKALPDFRLRSLTPVKIETWRGCEAR